MEKESQNLAVIKGPDNFRKLKGKLVSLTGKHKMSNINVFIYAQNNNLKTSAIVGVGITDKDGNFSIAYPNGVFSTAELKTNVSKETVVISLNSDGTFPSFAYAGLEKIDEELLENCSCGTKTPRLPDEEDFEISDSYSQDIGGSCVNFTTPNRALEEFSYYSIVRLTDPGVNLNAETLRNRLSIIDAQINLLHKELQIVPIAIKGANSKELSSSDDNVMYKDDYRLQMIDLLKKEREQLVRTGRKEVSIVSPISWDSDISDSNQATSLAFGHLLHFKQVWRADGYSLGDLVYSLPLAPGQKKRLAIMDWSRKESASKSDVSTYEESMLNTMSRDRDINEIVNSVLSESMSASSESKIKSNSWSVGASVSIPAGPVSVGVSGGYSSSNSTGNSSAEQNAARNLTAGSMQNIRDKSMQSASALRSQRSTVITTTEQSESMSVQTEVLANYNHCHAITIQYFEVLRHFALYTELADVQECVFIPLLMSKFNLGKVAKWNDSLEPYIKANNLQKYKIYKKGLEACVKEDEALKKSPPTDPYVGLPIGSYADDDLVEIWGKLKIRATITRPAEVYPDPMPVVPEGVLLESVRETIYSQALMNNPADKLLWQTQLGFIDNWESIRRKVYGVASKDRDSVFQAAISSINFGEQIINKMGFWLNKYSSNHPSQRIKPKFRTLVRNKASKMGLATKGLSGEVFEFGFKHTMIYNVTRAQLKAVQLWAQDFATSEFLGLPAGSFFILEEMSIQYKTKFFSGFLINSTGINDDLNKVLALTYDVPLSATEMKNVRLEYKEAKDTLIRHLNENIEYYHKVLWSTMDPDKRLMMLEAYHVEVPGRIIPGNTIAEPSEYRSLASLVENKLISIVGNSIVMPIAKGYNLNPRFRFDNDEVVLEDGRKISKLHNYYMPEGMFKSAPYRISVPTEGVFGEAVSGACNSCEKIDDSRFWKWEEHPIPDDTTEISPIDMGTRRSDPGDLSAKDFAQTLMQMKDPLAAVDPTGLGKALDIIGKGDSFRDITGLTENQKNALAGLQATQSGVEKAMSNSIEMSKQAAEMYKFQQNLKNSDKIEDKIKNSNLSDEKKQELMEKHLNSLIGGDTPKEISDNSDSPIGKLIDKAVSSNKGKVNYTDADGSSIDMDFDDANVDDEEIPTEDLVPGKSSAPAIIDNTEEIDLTDPDFIQKRALVDQSLSNISSELAQLVDQFSVNNSNPPMA
jgi:hypothetical protein